MSRPAHNENHERPAAERVVMVSKRDVDDLSHLLSRLIDSSNAEAVTLPGLPAVARKTLLDAASDELAARRRRAQLLPEGIFGEPAWEILITLYTKQGAARFTLARLTSVLSVPGTTALRWLRYLEDRNLITRTQHPTDLRCAFIELTADAIRALDVYFSERLTKVR